MNTEQQLIENTKKLLSDITSFNTKQSKMSQKNFKDKKQKKS